MGVMMSRWTATPRTVDEEVHEIHREHHEIDVDDPDDVEDAEDQVEPEGEEGEDPAEEEPVQRGLHQQERVVRDEIDEIAHRPT